MKGKISTFVLCGTNIHAGGGHGTHIHAGGGHMEILISAPFTTNRSER